MVRLPMKFSFFQSLKGNFTKTTQAFSTHIAEVFLNKKISSEIFCDLEEVLILADIGIATTQQILKKFSGRHFPPDISLGAVKEALSQDMADLISPYTQPLDVSSFQPYVVLVMGVNGSGKTTSIGKMAHYYQNLGKKVSLIAADTFRAAAVEQLKLWGEKVHCPVYSDPQTKDPAAVIYQGLLKATENKDDLVFIDTAGRLHNKKNLMDELQKITRLTHRAIAHAPHSTLVVLDACLGQNNFLQVKHFQEIIPLTGIILTKLDGTAKGGALMGLACEFKIPLHFIGIGEGKDHLKPFHAKDFTDSILDIK